MKKKILSQLVILSFAVAGLFLVGNNVFADPAVLMPPDDQSGGGGITCHQFAEPGRANQCWLIEPGWGSLPSNKWCYFTGYHYDLCSI